MQKDFSFWCKNTGATVMALGLVFSMASDCGKEEEHHKIRPQPVWSSIPPSKHKRAKTPHPTPVISCTRGDKRWVCPK
jgi:hypothetical protein